MFETVANVNIWIAVVGYTLESESDYIAQSARKPEFTPKTALHQQIS